MRSVSLVRAPVGAIRRLPKRRCGFPASSVRRAEVDGVSLPRMIDPELAAVLGALAFGVLLTLPGLHRAARRAENFCSGCGRRILLGQRTCDCD
jgi:hypothetical protein